MSLKEMLTKAFTYTGEVINNPNKSIRKVELVPFSRTVLYSLYYRAIQKKVQGSLREEECVLLFNNYFDRGVTDTSCYTQEDLKYINELKNLDLTNIYDRGYRKESFESLAESQILPTYLNIIDYEVGTNLLETCLKKVYIVKGYKLGRFQDKVQGDNVIRCTHDITYNFFYNLLPIISSYDESKLSSYISSKLRAIFVTDGPNFREAYAVVNKLAYLRGIAKEDVYTTNQSEDDLFTKVPEQEIPTATKTNPTPTPTSTSEHSGVEHKGMDIMAAVNPIDGLKSSAFMERYSRYADLDISYTKSELEAVAAELKLLDSTSLEGNELIIRQQILARLEG